MLKSSARCRTLSMQRAPPNVCLESSSNGMTAEVRSGFGLSSGSDVRRGCDVAAAASGGRRGAGAARVVVVAVAVARATCEELRHNRRYAESGLVLRSVGARSMLQLGPRGSASNNVRPPEGMLGRGGSLGS